MKLIKTILFNESLQAKNLLFLMRSYLTRLKENLIMKKNDLSPETEDITITNKIPENWWKAGFLLDNMSLSEFFIDFLDKSEYREILHSSMLFNKQEFTVDLARLFDPFSFFITNMMDYSMKNQVFSLKKENFNFFVE